MPDTAEILDRLHQEFHPHRESLVAGPSEKAASGRGFQRYFQAFADGFHQRAGLSPDGDTIADLSAQVRMASDRRTLLEDMRARVARVLDPLSMGYVEFLHRTHTDDPSFDTFSRSFHDRLTTLHAIEFAGPKDGASPVETENERRREVLERSLSFGCSNAAYVTLSQLDLLPRVFHAEHHRLPERQEFKGMAASLARLIHMLSSTHHEIHEALMGILRGPGWRLSQGDPFFWPPYRPEAFRLEGLRLELHPDIIEPARAMIGRRAEKPDSKRMLVAAEPRVGCPASKIIQTVHAWCMHVAEPVFFENADTLMRLPDDLLLARAASASPMERQATQ